MATRKRNPEFKRDANWWREETSYLSEQAEPYVRGYGPSEFADKAQFLRYATMQRDTAKRDGFFDAETYIQEIIDDVKASRAKRGKNPAKRPALGSPAYIGRKSERTKAKPTKRLRKRRKANKRAGYFPNPVVGFVIHAQRGSGPLMHYRGEKFTNNGAPQVFTTQAEAVRVAREILKAHAVMRPYRVTVEPYSPK